MNVLDDKTKTLNAKERKRLLQFVRRNYGTSFNITVSKSAMYPLERDKLGQVQRGFICEGNNLATGEKFALWLTK